MGFEPMKRFQRLHAFQACAFSHSAISPKNVCRYYIIFQGANVQKIFITNNFWAFLFNFITAFCRKT